MQPGYATYHVLRVLSNPYHEANEECSDFRWPQAIAGNRGHGRTHLFASRWSLQCMYALCAGCDFWEAAAVTCPVHNLRVKC